MKALVYLLAILCLISAAMYFAMPSGNLPSFMPGYEAGSAHMHTKHAIVAIVAAVVLFLIGWVAGRAARR